MVKFICLQGNNKGREFKIAQGTSLVGRAKGSPIFIFDVKCSHKHCRVQAKGPCVSIEDLKSCNGTWVNGRRVKGRVLLKDGDLVHIGDTVLQLKCKKTDPRQAAAEAGFVDDPKKENFSRVFHDATLKAVRDQYTHGYHAHHQHWWSLLGNFLGHHQ